MVIILNEGVDLVAEINRAVENAAAEDLIIAPTIASYNKTLKLLSERKPDTMVYVRLAVAKYFPAIAIELYHGADSLPVIDVQPPDDSVFADDTPQNGLVGG